MCATVPVCTGWYGLRARAQVALLLVCFCLHVFEEMHCHVIVVGVFVVYNLITCSIGSIAHHFLVIWTLKIVPIVLTSYYHSSVFYEEKSCYHS